MNSKKNMIKKWIRIIWISAGLAFIGWQFWSFSAKGYATELELSDEHVTINEDDGWIIFSPVSDSVKSAVLFFPGGGVDPNAYLPLNRKLAENGILSIIVKLPWRFAPFNSHKEEAVNNAIAAQAGFPVIENWVVCGHSKGGEMGALLAQKHASQIDALVLMGTSHPKRFDLSHLDIPVKKIYGTLDGVAPPHKIRETAENLPEHTQWIQIEGANHAQFGYYGPQLGDNDAAISREKQQKIVVSAIIETVKSTEK